MHFEPSAPLILASGSVVRGTMLRNAGLSFEVMPPDVDESVIKEAGLAAGDSVAEVAMDLAVAKADVVAEQRPEAIVIAADQMLEFQGVWLDKPRNLTEAANRLREFSGKSHRLITAMTVRQGPETLLQHTGFAELRVRLLSDSFIQAYLEKTGDEVCRSVGGYQLEGLGAQLFEQVDGDFFTILGLPLLPLLAVLRDRRAAMT